MTFLAPFVGYLIGSLPTANSIARLWGVDLRTSGTGNPGTNNARRAGGTSLAIAVLAVELGKGVLAVYVGQLIGGDLGMVLAGIGASAGNVYNVWYRFEGGKGLAISAGVVLGAWPTAFLIVVAVVIFVTAITRSSGIGALAAIATLVALGFAWPSFEVTMPWGIDDADLLRWLAIGMALVLVQKHWADARPNFRRLLRR
jgi:glycerol-3-phosphate acyltransferase PlsY